ncbi:chaplin family protein [Actinoplanes friuliensis]|jgi:hypothetical protein|uniref:Chaplin domain-containing protein n=1 Tax=Actinoplanes friuliensis DSM 7358 TaxID=1246995 RepID=U5W1P4_9ACTN|nr:chaplin family protein [Actinoplanes friuliensis]AGZ41841.1 hypothetical protein AFR_17815 [Actinoplanes friuliensis DSM 7358]
MKLVRGTLVMLGTAAAALAFAAGPASAHYDDDDNYGGYGGGSQSSHHNVGLLNGNQAYFPISVPLNFCGNSIALLGVSQSSAACYND